MFKVISKYLHKRIGVLITYTLIFISHSSLGLISPLIQSDFYDELVYGNNLNNIIKLIICLAVVALISFVMNYFLTIILVKLKENVSMDIKRDVVKHLQKSSLLQAEQYDPSYLTQRINSDSGNLMGIFLGNYASLINSVLSTFVILLIITNISKHFLFIFLGFVPLYALTYLLFKKKIYKYKYEQVEQQNTFFGVFSQQLRFLRKIKQDASFKNSDNRLVESFIKFYNKVLRETKLSQIYSGSEQIVSLLFQTLIFITAAFLIFSKYITFGQITIVLSYFQILKSYVSYYMSLGEYYQSAKVSANRIKELFDIKTECNGDIKPTVIDKIELKDITFSYSIDVPLNDNVIKSFSYVFNSGNIYTICGNNGIGKTTLMNIILGLYQELQAGSILYDNVDINKIDMYYLRENKISVVSQTITFIDDLVSDVLSLSDTDFVEYLRSFGEDSLFRNESFDIKSLFSKNCNELSGGERQKVALFYALQKKPQILMLDEPTSALDAKSIPYIIKLLNKLKEHMLIIIVTHDEQIQSIADFTISLTKPN